MKQNENNCPRNSLTMSVVSSSTTLLLLLVITTAVQGQQQRFFLPSSNNGNFDLPRVSFQDDIDDTELIVPQRRLSSADALPISDAGTSSFFSSQPQLPQGTFTNSGPFSRPPTTQQFILNGQSTQFQPVRNPGSLTFSDAVSAVSQPSFFQQAPIQQRPQQQQFNFFPGSSQQQQQQRFRPIAPQHNTEQHDSIERFNERQIPQHSLISQQSSQERINSDLSRRPLSQTNGNVQKSRTSPSVGPIRWWNSDEDSVAENVNNESKIGSSTNDDVLEFNKQKQIQEQQKSRRGQLQQGAQRPVSNPVSSSIQTSNEQEPAAIGFTVIHDENDNKSTWTQPVITTHRPQLGQTAFRNRNVPTVISGTTINRRPTTYNPISTTTPTKSPSFQPLSSVTINRQQTTTVRSRKSSLFTTTTTTMSTLEDEQEEDQVGEQQQEEDGELEDEKPELLVRKPTTTTQLPQVPITTLRAALRPKLNSLVPAIPQQQQRMKKVVNNPAIVQSITTRKPLLTSTSTLAPTTSTTTTTQNQVVEEYDDYEDLEYTTPAYTTTTSTPPSNKKQTKLTPVTQSSSPITTNKNNNNSIATTESWVVVSSVQTSRSVSSSSSLDSGTNNNFTAYDSRISTPTPPTTKHRFNNKPSITTTSTTTVESIIDKLDRVQSELSNGILYGSSSSNNNSSHILTDIQSSINNDDKRNDLIISSFTTPITESSTKTVTSTIIPTTIPSSTTSTSTSNTPSTIRTTTEREDDENDDKDEEDTDSEKETTVIRKFVPSKQRTSTIATVTTSSTVKSLIQPGKKKSIIDTVKFDELLTSGLLPPGFNPKPPPAYKSKIITTTTSTEIPLPVSNSISTSQSSVSKSSTTINTTPSATTTTTVKSKLSGLNIKFADDSDALASLLPPGFKLEDAIKPVETLIPSLLPPGYKPPADDIDTHNTHREQEVTSTTTDAPLISSTTTVASSSTTGIVFPNSSKAMSNSGTRKPLPSSKKIQASVTLAPVIQKGWPIRATTEFTGWLTPSTTPLSIEKLLSQSKASDIASVITSTSEPISSTTTTTTTTTMKPPPTTTPGQCTENDSVCELVGTVRLVGSGTDKWVPELLDHNTAEWRLLASEIETQLDKVYSKSPALSKWYKKITIDSFSPGNNGISNGKSDKNAGVLVDFFVQLNQLGRTVSTADIRRLFHETLQKEGNLGSSAQPLQYGNGGDYEGLYLKLGRFTVDAARTDFIVLPKPTRGVTAATGTDDAWLPQWAVAVMVIGLASLLFVLIFGITVLVTRSKNNKKVPPPTLHTSGMISDDHHQHMYVTGKNGPATGSRHMLHHPPSHSNSNYNISSYGYDNYAIDDDMMMLDEDDLEEVDRLYDMDAVWGDQDHEKPKVPTNGGTRKHRDSQQHGGNYDSWRSTALSPQALTPVQTGYYSGGGGYGYGTDPSGYGGDRRHYHREAPLATNPRSHHHYPSSHHNMSYPTSPRKPPQQYHPDYDTDF